MAISPTPVHILTGFLGSGKTTLLNRLLKMPAYEDTLVIVNEFGEISIDHHLVEASTETVFELSNGCLCCTIRGELVETLLSLDLDRFKRVIIETTGIANPMPLFQNLTSPELQGGGLYPASILAVYDNVRGENLIKEHPEARQQLALADIIFISRTDIKPDTAQAGKSISGINPTALCVSDPDRISLDNQHKEKSDEFSENRNSALVPNRHANEFSSLVLETGHPQSLAVFAGFLHHLSNVLGPGLLRAKGFGYCEENDFPVLLQMSGQILHDPVPLEDWPDDKKQTHLVIIGKDINRDQIRSIFNSFFSVAAVDTPDRDALTNNPLSIPGA